MEELESWRSQQTRGRFFGGSECVQSLISCICCFNARTGQLFQVRAGTKPITQFSFSDEGSKCKARALHAVESEKQT